MKTTPTVTPTATIRTRDPVIIEALDEAADSQHRSRTSQALHYITEGLIRDGYIDEDGPKVGQK